MATFRATVNPIKAGGLNLCTAGGGSVRCPPPPLRKRPDRMGIGLKCIFIDQFFKATSLKKIRLITLTDIQL